MAIAYCSHASQTSPVLNPYRHRSRSWECQDWFHLEA